MIRILTSRLGKLWEALEKILRESYFGGKNVLLVVPDQMTLQAERDAMKSLQVKGFFRLQVLSPARLAKVVFDRAGQDERVVIDERGQSMTLSRALWNLKDELSYYATARTKPGFTMKLIEAISEFKGAGLTPFDLLSWAEKEEAGSAKLKDLALLYAAYEEQMQGQLCDSEDRGYEMLRRLSEGEVFKGHDILVYGFDLLTPPLIRLFAVLAKQADNFTLTMRTESREAPDGLAFEPVNDSLRQFHTLLIENGLKPQVERLTVKETGQPAALYHLQEQMLRMKQQAFEGVPDGLRLYAAKTANDEIRRAAQRIFTQLREGQDVNGIAVYLAQDSYAALLPDIFSAYGIRHFVSVKEPLTAQPLVRCLMDAMKCVQAAVWRPFDVFNYIKSPYSPLSPQQAFELENYARENGIRGKKWTQPFVRGEAETLQKMEALREAAITPVDRMRQSLAKARNAAASIQAALDFLRDIGAMEKVSALEEELTSKGLLEEAQRTRQVWDRLMGFFEQMNQLLGEERVPLGRFAEWLTAGLSMSSLSALPPLQDSVQVGLLGQLMKRSPDIVYILGLNSGVLNVGDETLVSDPERATMEHGMNSRLNLQVENRESIRQLDLWKAIADASKEVNLSYSLSDEEGKAKTPLMELTRIKKMFPLLTEEGGALFTLRETQPFTPMVALDEVAVLLARGEMSPPWWQAYNWLSGREPWNRYLKGVSKALIPDDPDKELRPETARELFRKETSTVTRLETYAGCPFKHFVDYGLSPRERKEWELDSRDFGTFSHAAMEGFAREAMADPKWPDVDRARSDSMMDKVLMELTRGYEDKPMGDTRRARRNAEHAFNLCRRMAWAVTEGGNASRFRLTASELRFGPGEAFPGIEVALENGETLKLRGTIDRVDTVVLDSGLHYVRVVDYKSGNVKVDAGELEAGSQLQLMLYLCAALEYLSGAKPAGAFYQQMKDPLVEADSEEKAARESRKDLRMNGVMLNDAHVVALMDEAQPPITMTRYTVKDGIATNTANSILSAEELDSLLNLARRRTRELAGDIFSGLIARSPLINSKGILMCEYCRYQGVCRIEKPSREPNRRRTRKISLKGLAGEQLEEQGAATE